MCVCCFSTAAPSEKNNFIIWKLFTIIFWQNKIFSHHQLGLKIILFYVFIQSLCLEVFIKPQQVLREIIFAATWLKHDLQNDILYQKGDRSLWSFSQVDDEKILKYKIILVRLRTENNFILCFLQSLLKPTKCLKVSNLKNMCVCVLFQHCCSVEK